MTTQSGLSPAYNVKLNNTGTYDEAIAAVPRPCAALLVLNPLAMGSSNPAVFSSI